VSKEEIARVKAEWDAKEARKKKEKDVKGKETSKNGGKDAGGEAGDGEKEEGGKKGTKSPSPSGTSPTATGSGSGAATHKRYSLHRDFFAMRQAEHRHRRQTKQTQELAPRLPGTPHGSVG
jgi:AAA-ATPase Vps4-associated protein 1